MLKPKKKFSNAFEILELNNISNTKLNVYKKVLQEVCEKFNGVEQYIKESIEVLCSESKLSAEEVTYLFTNNYKFC